MKENNVKLNTVLFLFLMGFLISFIDSSSQTIIAEASIDSIFSHPDLQALTPHGPIFIEYDSNFTDYGFPGAGIAGDPYRIENYNITISGDYPILFGGNNTDHFVIQNCFLKTDTNAGIFLGKYYDMGNGTVRILNNVIISESSYGIILNGGNYSTITENNINSNYYCIQLDSCVFSLISKNTIHSKNDAGMDISFCSNITVTKNTCLECYEGIILAYSDNSIITHNNITESGNDGIYLQDSAYVTISNNYFIESVSRGIYSSSSYNSVITNNLFQGNGEYGISLVFSSSNNVVHHNAFIENNLAGTSQANDDGSNNIWYDDVTSEGNYWNEWVSGSYSIDGTASSVDPYPLGSMPVIPEYSSLSLAFLLTLCTLIIPVISFVSRKKLK